MEQPLVQQNFESNPGIMYKLGSIEAQLKSINEKLDAKEQEQDVEIRDLQKEVGKLKEWRMWNLGAGAVIAFLLSLAAKVLPIG